MKLHHLRSLTSALALTACGDDAARDDQDATPEVDSADTVDGDVPDTSAVIPPYDPPPISWSPCGTGGWSCGDLIVPRDYGAPDGPSLKVHVARHAASDPERRIGVLLVNPGGPGGGAEGFARDVLAIRPDVGVRFDLVALDPRGTGQSEPRLTCLGDEDLDAWRATSTRVDPDGARLMTAYLRAQCAALGEDVLASIGTTESARDMESLRKALVAADLNFVGASYGTALGLAYASLYPERVRAFVLDAPVAPRWVDTDMLLEGARSRQREIDRFLAWCADGDPGACALDEGDVAATRAAWDMLFADVEAGLVTTSRGPLAVDDLTSVVLAVLAMGSSSTQSEDAFSRLESLLEAMLVEHDGAGVLELADLITGRGPDGHYDSQIVANHAIMCRDGLAAASQEAFDAMLAEVGRDAPDITTTLLSASACVGWAAPAAPPRLDAAGAPPMLVLAGERDPSTPIAWADEVLGHLDNGSDALVWHGAGHAFWLRAGLADRVQRFLEDPSALVIDPYECPARSPTPVSAISGYAADRLDVEVRAGDDDRILVAKTVAAGDYTLTLPEAYGGRWLALRYTAAGAAVVRRYLDLADPLLPQGLSLVDAADVTFFTDGAAALDPARGIVQVAAYDCDRQAAIGAQIVVDGERASDVVYAGGDTRCRATTPGASVTRCARALLPDLAPGDYRLGLEHGEVGVDGPTVVVEPGSYVVVRALAP